MPVSVMPPVLLTAMLVSAVPPPTMPPKLTAPLPAVTVRVYAPLTVLLKLTLLSVVASVLLAASVTGPV